MALRLLISDALWSKIEPVLQELKHAAGSPPGPGSGSLSGWVLHQGARGLH